MDKNSYYYHNKYVVASLIERSGQIILKILISVMKDYAILGSSKQPTTTL